MTVYVKSKLQRSLHLTFDHRQTLFLILYLMKFGFLLFEENYQWTRCYMSNDSFICSAWKRVDLYKLKDGENLKDDQRNEISIRNIKLSERKSRSRCIH